MNKQEVIEEIKKQSMQAYDDFAIIRDTAIYIVNQLDEPEKPIVPQFVADWYEENKDDFEFNLYCLCVDFNCRPVKLDNRINRWFSNTSNKSIQTLVAMHFFGYEVEKEKLYTARLKVSGEYLNSEKANKRYMMGSTNKNLVKELKSYCYTQAELKELNIWDNPAFEVEEVKE